MWWSPDQHKADFLDLANLQTKMVDLPIDQIYQHSKNHESKTDQIRGFLTLLFSRDMTTKMVKKLIHCETPDLL